MNRSDLVAAHAALVIGRSFEVEGAAGRRREIKHRVRTAATAIGIVEQMARRVENAKIRVGQRAKVAGQALGAELVDATSDQVNAEHVVVARHADHRGGRRSQDQLAGADRRGDRLCDGVAEIISRCVADAQLISAGVVAESALDFDEIQAVGRRREIGARIQRATKVIGLEDGVPGSVMDDDQRVGQRVEFGCIRDIADRVNQIHLTLGQPDLDPVTVAVVRDQAMHRCAGLQDAVGLDIVAEVVGQGRARQGVSALACIARCACVEVIPTRIGRPVDQLGIAAAAAVVVLRQQDAADRAQRQLRVGQRAATTGSTEIAEGISHAAVKPDLEPVMVGQGIDFAGHRKLLGAAPLKSLKRRGISSHGVQARLSQGPGAFGNAADVGDREVEDAAGRGSEHQGVVTAHAIGPQIEAARHRVAMRIQQLQLRVDQGAAGRRRAIQMEFVLGAGDQRGADPVGIVDVADIAADYPDQRVHLPQRIDTAGIVIEIAQREGVILNITAVEVELEHHLAALVGREAVGGVEARQPFLIRRHPVVIVAIDLTIHQTPELNILPSRCIFEVTAPATALVRRRRDRQRRTRRQRGAEDVGVRRKVLAARDLLVVVGMGQVGQHIRRPQAVRRIVQADRDISELGIHHAGQAVGGISQGATRLLDVQRTAIADEVVIGVIAAEHRRVDIGDVVIATTALKRTAAVATEAVGRSRALDQIAIAQELGAAAVE